MYNREIYRKDPLTVKLLNEGVAKVNDERMDVLRYELETFVCDGQYEKGLARILETYLKNIGNPQQPGVWVSGFFGAGKSHLVKMLKALWIDTIFEDGATARGIASLPVSINELLKELSIQAKRHGGLHAASGTLGSSSRDKSVRLALLAIIFKSIGLPEEYNKATFVLWLKNEGIFKEVCERVEKLNHTWQEELDNFHVAEGLYQALCEIKPHIFSQALPVVEIMPKLYPFVNDISIDEMLKSIRQALTEDGKFPLTLIALDEVQQYIGEDSQRSLDVQETVEACCKSFGGKLLFIGTGQTAITGTTNLKKLEARFTIRIELSDTDVETVIRKVVLHKKPEAIVPIEKVMQSNIGEISRHLDQTTIRHHENDNQNFAQDYPILPVRRRFWECILRAIDRTGTESQLRNQLSMVHKAIQTNLSESLGHVIPADFLYFDAAEKLLQTAILPRKIYEATIKWKNGTKEEILVARACGLIFLINKLSQYNDDIGLKARADVLADLMVEDLSAGSSSLRSALPGLLDKCAILMKVGDEYRIQTEESIAWNNEFFAQRSQIANQSHQIEIERDSRIKSMFNEVTKKISLIQGNSRIKRELNITFDSQLSSDSAKRIYILVRDGWGTDENSVIVDARQAGNQSPTIFCFLPRRSADELRHNIMDFMAARATLDRRGIANTPESIEARDAMETIKKNAEAKIQELINSSFNDAHIFQAGGNEINESNLQQKILKAAESSLQRLFPQFRDADHSGWAKVYLLAQKGDPESLKAVDYDGEPAKNKVCNSILKFIVPSKKGIDIRNYFEAPPFGWSGDAIDGALQILMITGAIHACDDRGNIKDPKQLERKMIGKVTFKVEMITITANQCIAARKFLQSKGFQASPGDESSSIKEFLKKFKEIAEGAGNSPPKPARPDVSLLEAICAMTGNQQIIEFLNNKDDISRLYDEFNKQKQLIEQRWQSWEDLEKLLHVSSDIKIAQEIKQQANFIKQQRMLIAEPDPIQPLLMDLESALRKELLNCQQRYFEELQKLYNLLEDDESWRKLTADERDHIIQQCEIIEAPVLKIGTRFELMQALEQYPIKSWQDRIDALSSRFANVRELAAKTLEPEAQSVILPRRTLKTEQDIEAWLQEVREKLKAILSKGPIIIP